MATVLTAEDRKSDLERFCERYPDAGEAREVPQGKMNYLGKNRKLQVGPTKGESEQGVTILFALTKATGSNPNGEIVYAIPRSGR